MGSLGIPFADASPFKCPFDTSIGVSTSMALVLSWVLVVESEYGGRKDPWNDQCMDTQPEQLNGGTDPLC